jgi:ketosteroid isomerase-like protein
MSEENVEVVRRVFDLWDRGDRWAGLDSIDTDVEVVVDAQVDLDGTYRGHAGLGELMRAFWGAFENIRTRIEEAIPAGSHVVVAVRFSGRGKRSGVEIDMPQWQVWTVRNGKVVRWRIVRTKRDALKAAGLSEDEAHGSSS